jgi:hypothetical protein
MAETCSLQDSFNSIVCLDTLNIFVLCHTINVLTSLLLHSQLKSDITGGYYSWVLNHSLTSTQVLSSCIGCIIIDCCLMLCAGRPRAWLSGCHFPGGFTYPESDGGWLCNSSLACNSSTARGIGIKCFCCSSFSCTSSASTTHAYYVYCGCWTPTSILCTSGMYHSVFVAIINI